MSYLSHLLPRKLKKAARVLVFEEDKARYNTKWKRRIRSLLQTEESTYIGIGEVCYYRPYVNPYGNLVNLYMNQLG